MGVYIRFEVDEWALLFEVSVGVCLQEGVAFWLVP